VSSSGFVEANPGGLRRLGEVAAGVALYPRTVARHFEVLTNFYGRELRGRFRGTVLGYLWPFALPLVLFLVYYFIFVNLLGAKLGYLEIEGMSREEQDQLSKRWFTVYLFVGVMAWAGFAESITRNVNVILENSNLIKKISFPSEILPLNIVLVSLTIQAFGLAAYLCMAPVLGWNPISWRLLALPALFGVQALFALGISLAVAALNVFVRDTAQILGIGMTFWQFLTPVFWSPAVLGVEGMTRYAWVMRWNPMHHLLEGYRRVLVNPGLPEYRKMDARLGIFTDFWPWKQCALVALAGAVLFVIGYSIFLLSKRRFADEL
jgi:homopolymeric O-antigen transport system permease protein